MNETVNDKIINILGTDYIILKKEYSQEPEFDKRKISGFCDWIRNKIVICDMKTYPGYEDEDSTIIEISERNILRHEIIHAFLFESGLGFSSAPIDAWAVNEEMVDWIALQLPKIIKVLKSVNAI